MSEILSTGGVVATVLPFAEGGELSYAPPRPPIPVVP
jgi:hypothetical protein